MGGRGLQRCTAFGPETQRVGRTAAHAVSVRSIQRLLAILYEQPSQQLVAPARTSVVVAQSASLAQARSGSPGSNACAGPPPTPRAGGPFAFLSPHAKNVAQSATTTTHFTE